MTKKLIDPGSQGRPFAKVGRMLEEFNFGDGGGLLKNIVKGRCTAIVDQDDLDDALMGCQ